MQHSFPRCEGQPSWQRWLYVLLLLWCAGLALFFLLTMPHAELCRWYAFFLLLALLPLPAVLLSFFGRNVVQVEHAGVVLSTLLWGFCLRRRVWVAGRVLAFDWAEEHAAFACYLIVTPFEGAQRGARCTLLATPSPYAAAALLRDLELHYPGSGLRAEHPVRLSEGRQPSRALGAAVLVLACVYAAVVGPRLLLPLRVALEGETQMARVERVVWEGEGRNSSWHLEASLRGELLESARSFPAGTRPPSPGQPLMLRAAPGLPFYEGTELVAYLLPLPLGGLGLLMFFLGARVCLAKKRCISPAPAALQR